MLLDLYVTFGKPWCVLSSLLCVSSAEHFYIIKAGRAAEPWQGSMAGSAKLRQAAPCSTLLRLLPWWVMQCGGVLQSTAKVRAPRELQEHTLLNCEQLILWAEGVWIKTCRGIK